MNFSWESYFGQKVVTESTSTHNPDNSLPCPENPHSGEGFSVVSSLDIKYALLIGASNMLSG